MVYYSSSFLECYKWNLHTSEVKFIGDRVYSITQNISYNPGEYIISKSGKFVKVCVHNELRPEVAYYTDFFYVISCFVSIPSLIAAICILWLKPRRSYAARTPMFCHMITLIFFYVASEIYMIVPLPPGIGCKFLLLFASVMQRAAFCWLNVVMFNLWKKFRPKTIYVTVSNKISWKIFFFQAVYAWGLNVILVVIMQVFKSKTNINYDESHCQIQFITRYDKIIVLADVTSALPILANVTFAGLTIINVRKISKEVATCNENAPSQLLSVNIRIIVMTGIAWIIRSVQWVMMPFTVTPPLVWMVADILSPLQGFLLLLIFGCSLFNCKKNRPISNNLQCRNSGK